VFGEAIGIASGVSSGTSESYFLEDKQESQKGRKRSTFQ
jgi:hypothetical protein